MMMLIFLFLAHDSGNWSHLSKDAWRSCDGFLCFEDMVAGISSLLPRDIYSVLGVVDNAIASEEKVVSHPPRVSQKVFSMVSNLVQCSSPRPPLTEHSDE